MQVNTERVFAYPYMFLANVYVCWMLIRMSSTQTQQYCHRNVPVRTHTHRDQQHSGQHKTHVTYEWYHSPRNEKLNHSTHACKHIVAPQDIVYAATGTHTHTHTENMQSTQARKHDIGPILEQHANALTHPKQIISVHLIHTANSDYHLYMRYFPPKFSVQIQQKARRVPTITPATNWK